MTITRVLLVDMSQLLRDVVSRVIGAHPDLEVIGSWAGGSVHVVDALRRDAPDVVVIGARRPELPDLIIHLVESRSPIRVVAMAGDGQHAFLCSPLGEVSTDGLLTAIRPPNTSRRRP